jgi:Sec-independent protein secretion pathway component TatC
MKKVIPIVSLTILMLGLISCIGMIFSPVFAVITIIMLACSLLFYAVASGCCWVTEVRTRRRQAKIQAA